MTKTTQGRALNVQTPGEAPKENPEATASTTGGTTTGHAEGAAAGDASEVIQVKLDTAAVAGGGTAIDLESMREQIRAEERAIIHAELSAQINAARAVAERPDSPPLGKNDYRNMRAADIDPSTLTAPVMTKDGYLCPLPVLAEKK